jgi:hypothetical protein
VPPQVHVGGGGVGAVGLLLTLCELVELETLVVELVDRDLVLTVLLPSLVTVRLVVLEFVSAVVFVGPVTGLSDDDLCCSINVGCLLEGVVGCGW